MKPIFEFYKYGWWHCLLILLLPLNVVAQPDTGPVFESLKIEGNDHISTSQLKSQMMVKATPWYDFMPFVQPRKFDVGLFHSDMGRLTTYYESQGYYHSVIDTTIKVSKEGHLLARIQIDEGPRTHIRTVQVVGIDSSNAQHVDAVEDLIELVEAPFVETQLSSAVTDALGRFKNLGYAFGKADLTTYVDSLWVNVEVSFALGPICEIADIQISGNENVSNRTIRRGMTFSEGEVFEGKQLDDTRRQLYRAGVFRSVIVELPDTIMKKTPVRVKVTERPFRNIRLGGGYDTEIGWRASATWMHRNFAGSAKQLRLSSTISKESRELVASIRRPYFFGGKNWLNVSSFLQRRKDGDAQQNEVGGGASFERNVKEQLDFLLQFNGGLVGTDRDSAFTEVRAALRWDTRDDLFDPHKGTLASITVRERGWWLQSDWEFWELTAEGRWFQPLGSQNVLGFRIVGGKIFRIQKRSPVPRIERYYSGGLNSVRGWSYQELGPKAIGKNEDGDDEVISFGGTSHFEGSIELRTHIWGYLGSAVFVDVGQVANGYNAFNLADLKWAVGAGLRLLTPVGPIRFDVGYRLSDDPVLDSHEKFDSRWRMHWSLGQAF